MLIVSFLSWWYGRGWQQIPKSFGPRSQAILESFSVSQLIKTWFEPWKRIITYPGDSIGEKIKAWGDNAFSRVIGFIVRSAVLLTALITWLAAMLFTALEIIIWPLMPPAVPVLLIVGVLV